jgi:WD40 repeat protein
LAAGSEGNMVIVDTAARSIVQRLQGHSDDVKSVAVSADGAHIVSCGTDGTVRVWDAPSGKTMSEPLLGHEGQV